MAIGCVSRTNMGLDFGLDGLSACFPKVKNRWLFQIDGVCGVANALPPFKASRPQFDFKEQQVEHLIQPIYYPIKVDWKPIQLTLYDNQANTNLVFKWMQQVYDPDGDTEWQPVFNAYAEGLSQFNRDCVLCLYDGCGNVTESWWFENAYPQAINWGDLVMNEVSVVTVDITLRYDRAYIKNGGGSSSSGGTPSSGSPGSSSPSGNNSPSYTSGDYGGDSQPSFYDGKLIGPTA